MTTPRPWRGVVVCETVAFTMDDQPSVVEFDLGELSREPERSRCRLECPCASS